MSDPAQELPVEALTSSQSRYNSFLLLIAGLGGLLYGVDVGIIGGALPYLQATSQLSPGELSIIVAAVLLGSVFSTLFAGVLADGIGRRPLMQISAVAFILSIPMIALSSSYGALFFGRLLQGMSGGFIGVVVPLYLAECLSASRRGKGTGAFQWLLTLGIVVAALVGIFFSYRVAAVEQTASASALWHFKDRAWRQIFWVSLPPGILFLLGSFFVSESPRWLLHKGRREEALQALLRSRNTQQSQLELQEMEESDKAKSQPGKHAGSLLQRKYIYPFLLSCLILFCNTATGINSIIGYNTEILLQSGLSDLWSHWGYVFFTLINFLMTIVGMMLVDRKGRKFLLTIGTGGIIASMIFVGTLFVRTEGHHSDARAAVQSLVDNKQGLQLHFDTATAQQLLNSAAGDKNIDPQHASLAIIYSYGGFTSSTSYVRSSETGSAPIVIKRDASLPGSNVEAFFRNPIADLNTARHAPLKIEKALISNIPSTQNGILVGLGLYLFMAFYAMGPGVCVWLALSELMPTRIRSNGMSFALVINQLVSTVLAAIFLPFVSVHGYSSIFFLFAGFTLVYFFAAIFLLPETKGKTLEEIETFFASASRR